MLIDAFKSEYDVAVIGAGMGGLTSAALLSKAGFSVCVLDKEPHAGGYLAGFRRKDFRFDTAIHWLNQCSPGGVVEKIFSIIGADYPRVIPQKRIRRYLGAHHDYLLTSNPDELKEQWIKEFPKDKDGIKRFFKAAKKIGKAFNQFNTVFRTEESMVFLEKLKNKWAFAKFGTAFIPYLGYTGAKGLKRGLNKFFLSQKLHDVFAGENELIGCLVPIGWAYYNDFQSPPKGGSQVFPEWLQHVIKYFENDIYLGCTVKEIIVQGNTAQGIKFNYKTKTKEIKAKYIIAACDIETLYSKLLPPNTVAPSLLQKLNDADMYSSSVTVSIALDCCSSKLGFNEEMVHISNEAAFGEIEEVIGDPQRCELSVLAPSLRDPSLAPPGKGTLTIYMPAQMHYKNNWLVDFDEHGNYIRGEAYVKLKNEIAETLINRVEQMMAPGLKSHILFYEVATPVTHWRYTGNKNGTMMGTKPSRKNMRNKIAQYQTPLKNLLLGGHWAELGGGVPIAVKAGTNAALLILQKEKHIAFKYLADYMTGKINAEAFLNTGVFKPYNNSWVRNPTPAEKAIARTV